MRKFKWKELMNDEILDAVWKSTGENDCTVYNVIEDYLGKLEQKGIIDIEFDEEGEQ